MILVGLVLFVVASIVLLKIIKHTIVAIFSIIGLFLLLSAGVGFMVYNDVMEIKDNVMEKPSVFLLVEQEEVMAGVIFNPSIEQLEEAVSPLGQDEIIYIEEKEDDYDTIITEMKDVSTDLDAELFRIVEFDKSIIEESEVETINIQFFEIEKEQLLMLLESDSILDDIVDIILEDQQLWQSIQAELPDVDIEGLAKEEIMYDLQTYMGDFAQTNTEIKGILFMLALGSIFEGNPSEGAVYFYDCFKEEKINIHPESISFSLLKLSPKNIVEAIIEQVNPEQR